MIDSINFDRALGATRKLLGCTERGLHNPFGAYRISLHMFGRLLKPDREPRRLSFLRVIGFQKRQAELYHTVLNAWQAAVEILIEASVVVPTDLRGFGREKRAACLKLNNCSSARLPGDLSFWSMALPTLRSSNSACSNPRPDVRAGRMTLRSTFHSQSTYGGLRAPGH